LALSASGVYETVIVSVPTLRDRDGMIIVALPLLSATADELYVPAARITVPVGVLLPVPPVTRTITGRLSVTATVDEAGITVRMGVIFVTTVMFAVPEASP
jgi:hypothetical protein